MKNMNEFFIIGRQTKDIGDNYRVFENGSTLLNLSIAVNSSRKVGDQWQDEANFFDVSVWGRQAETLSNYIHKGKLLAIRGHLQQQKWTDSQTGQTRSRIALIADEVELLSSNKDASSSGNNAAYAAPAAPAPAYAQPAPAPAPAGYAVNGACYQNAPAQRGGAPAPEQVQAVVRQFGINDADVVF